MVELQVLSKVLKDRNLSLLTLNNITDDYFITYQTEYEFIRDHVQKYGNVPDKETFLAKFPDFTIVEVSETDKYLIDTFNEEHLYAKAVPVVNKIAELMHDTLRAGIYVAAVSQRRIGDLLQSVHTISGCVVGPQTAKAYGGLLDYRARSGESRRTLLLEDRSPVYDKAEVCNATGLTEAQLKENLA